MPDPAIAERMAISDAIDAAEMAVAAVNDTSDATTVTDAETAVTDARARIMAATNVPQAERDANSETVNAIENRLNAAKSSRTTAMAAVDAEEKRVAKAMAAKLYAGLATEDAAATTVTNALAAATIDISGMNVMGDADGTGAGDPVTIKPSGTTVSTLHGWAGTDYVRKPTSSMLTDHVVLYNNREEPEMELFATKYADQLAEDSDNGRLNNTYLTAGTTNKTYIASDTFASGSGFVDHTVEANDVVKIRGTFNGGMGYYHCAQAAADAPCRSAVDGADGITLTGGWSFEPDEGTMARTPDTEYVLFGWWSRDVGGVDVRTFAQREGGATDLAGAANVALTGTAMYVGGAAGKYSINEPVEGNPNSGAFTAKAEFTAEFGSATDAGTIKGMLTGFHAGGMDRDWTVELKGAGTDDETAIVADGFGTAATTSTVWTIDGVAGSASGGWSGDFYYNTADQQTAANTPPTAAGTFTSNYSNVGRMVGAFGATKQ